jgi:microcystin-dependent protein
VTLLESEIPPHSHAVDAPNTPGNVKVPSPSVTLSRAAGARVYGPAQNLVSMAAQTLAPAGGGQPHNNMQPYLTRNFCIALQGVVPPRG